MAAVERLAGTLPGGLRRTVVAQQATVEQPAQGPGLVVLDRHGQRQRTGARLDGEPQGRVSVIIEPPRPDELAPLLVAAYGLSDREQAVAALVFQGRSTRRQIARALSISPYTVPGAPDGHLRQDRRPQRRAGRVGLLPPLPAADPRLIGWGRNKRIAPTQRYRRSFTMLFCYSRHWRPSRVVHPPAPGGRCVARPWTAHARAIRLMEPSAAIGRPARMRSRSALRRCSSRDMV
jgi:hypothetical protein